MNLQITKYVIGVDPAFGGHCETGIILTGIQTNNIILVLEDFSGTYGPETWIYIVQLLSIEFNGLISIEINQGGNLVTSMFNGFPLLAQRAINSKYERAMACYMMYKKKQVIHLYPLINLEEQMLFFSTCKKDRVDALVWALLYFYQNYNTPSVLIQ